MDSSVAILSVSTVIVFGAINHNTRVVDPKAQSVADLVIAVFLNVIHAEYEIGRAHV